MKKSLRNRVIVLILVFALLLDILCITMNYRNFVQANEQFSYSTARTVTETCNLIIDKDKLNVYMETGKRDSRYYEIWNKLIDYRNTNSDIIGLSLVWFDKEGCHYIFDTDLTLEGAFLKDRREYDGEQKKYMDSLIRGEEIDFINYPNYMAVYQPILSSFNLPIGYVIVEISTLKAKEKQRAYLFEMVCVLTLLTVVLMVILLLVLNRMVIRPINQLSEAAFNYVSSIHENGEKSTLEQLSIHTGDEIERLFIAIKKMETDLLTSSDNLAVAQWNSHHDSMTQLFNKRYFYEYMEGYAKGKPVGVFYFDVDNLKKMNDTYGHEAGDEVICKTAEFVKRYTPGEGGGFRMGGDEFVMVIPGMEKRAFYTLADKMKLDGERVLTPADYTVQCRIALGYAYSDKCGSLTEVMKTADENMYLDKTSHR
ncbi:MAG: GGDEF domain-containing protein [Lachnospiraceae bacterium]|jgi:diguanylate cyclase (GGDEF)-like protein|nr:GGDEF domain-containing protein [Lachnospiraceae bacterium]